MKKIMAILLAIAMMTATLAACNSETPIETPDDPNEQLQEENEMNNGTEDVVIEEPVVIPEYSETEVGAENTLFGKNEKITLNVIENSLYVTDLSTLENSENKLMENSAFLLPKYIKVDKKRTALNWEYVSAVKYENKEVNGVFTNGLIYKFHDAEQALDLRVYCAVRPEISGPFEFYMEIDNLGEVETRITLEGGFTSFSTKVVDPAKTNIVRIASEGFIAEGHVQNADALNNPNYKDGAMYDGAGIEIFNLESSGAYLVSSERLDFQGNGGHYLAQFIDRTTDGVFVALGWTTGRVWSKIENDEYIETKASLDNDEGKFATLLQPGDTFVVPSVYILPYEGNMDKGSNIFKSWFFDCKVVPTLRDDPALPYVQIDIQMSPEDAKAANIDSMKREYGWWSGIGFNAERALPYESSWTLMAEGLDTPNYTFEDFKSYGEKLDSLGLNYAVYILLHENMDENGNPTDQFGELNAVTHPEWFSDQKHPFCRLADLGNVECVEYLKTTLEKFFKNTKADQWRTDFEPIAAYSDQQNRHDANGSDVQYWCTVGFSEIVRHLYDTVEGFKFESCNSGGGNKDLYIAELTTFFNCDDTANYLSLRASFYDSSYIIHPAQLEIPCNIETFNPNCEQYFFPVIPRPEVADGDSYDFTDAMLDMGFRSTVIGIPMWAPWTGNVMPDYYKEYATMYKENIKPLVRDGELYHILPRPDGVNWDGIMYADPDSVNEIKGAVFLFKPSAEVSDIYNVVFEGLNENTVYQLTFEDRSEQNCTATGADLMTKGLDVEIKYVGSEIIWITEAE